MKKIALPGITALAFFAFSACIYAGEQQGTAPQNSPPLVWYEPGEYTAERYFTIEIINDGAAAMVTGFNAAAASSISIPPYIQGLPVTAIQHYAFYNRGLTSVVIPEGVTDIGRFAFSRNHLTEVELQYGITIVGEWAFAHNPIRALSIPNSVFSLRQGAFAENQLTQINIPESVLVIGHNVFEGNLLTEVAIPRNIPLGFRTFDDGVTIQMPAPEPNEILPAIPSTVAVSVNGRHFSAPAWNVGAASYFRVRDIAYMLNATRAQFYIASGQPPRFRPPQAAYWLERGHYAPTGTEMGAIGTGARQAELVRDSSRVFGGIDIGRIFFPSMPIFHHFELDTVRIDGQSYFSLASFGQMLGFDLAVDAATGAISIDTREPAFSEYGLRVAREFLLPFRTLHDPDAIPEQIPLEEGSWPRLRLVDRITGLEIESSLYRNPRGYIRSYSLYDFRGNGIPEIYVHWYFPGDRGLSNFYVYRNGAFVQEFWCDGWTTFFSDGHGHIYISGGGGDGTIVTRVTFEDDGMHTFAVGAGFTPDVLALHNDAGARRYMQGQEFLALRREGLLGNLLDDFPEFALFMERHEYLNFARPLDLRIFPRATL